MNSYKHFEWFKLNVQQCILLHLNQTIQFALFLHKKKQIDSTQVDSYNTQPFIHHHILVRCTPSHSFVRSMLIHLFVRLFACSVFYVYNIICIRSVPLEWMLNYAKINSKCGWLSNNNIDIIHLAHTLKLAYVSYGFEEKEEEEEKRMKTRWRDKNFRNERKRQRTERTT